ncbi:MAG: GFA family protein [Pseudomonadota bacterium]
MTARGSCLCVAITFEVAAGPVPSSACHCSQGRKQSGHYWAAGWVPEARVTVAGNVAWYQSSAEAKRGFCGICGSTLFWKHRAEAEISFSLGALDEEAGVRLEKHIFVADKGDYYAIADGLPQKEQ